ncbi:MAG: Wzy polymerase domain-containing protein [Polaromonas sp.]|nr:Wzy polymerase domain-containing protein [Polaromonas sp.]MDO9259136.1 Wzy polymerase domain-containing protein [Polaromonas sp.]
MPLHFLPWVSWHSDALVFIGVFALAWAALFKLGVARKQHLVGFPTVTLPFIGFALVTATQLLTGVMTFFGDALIIWFYMSLCLICLLTGFCACRESLTGKTPMSQPRLPVILAWTIVAGGVLSTTIALVQATGAWEHSQWILRMPTMRRPGGNMAQPNHLATLLVMAIASVVYLCESKYASDDFSISAVFFLCLGLAATESRTGVLSFGLLLVWWISKRVKIFQRISLMWAGAMGCSFALLFFLWPIFFNAFYVQMGEENARVRADGSRLEMWRQMLDAISLRPWWGWGVREVSEAHNQVVDRYQTSWSFTYSHNFLIDLMTWVGIPVSVLFLVVAVIWVWRRVSATDELLPWYCLAVAIPLAVHSQLEFPFAYAYFLAPVLLLLGCMEASLGAKSIVYISRRQGAAALLFISVLLVWSAIEYLEIEEDFRVVRFEVLRIGTTPSEHHRPRIVLLTQLGALLDGARVVPQRNMPLDQITLLGDVALHYPWRAPQYSYALALALNGNPIEASRQIQVMRRQHGELFYADIKKEFEALGRSKYLELGNLNLP